jgi:hypothetical protein
MRMGAGLFLAMILKNSWLRCVTGYDLGFGSTCDYLVNYILEYPGAYSID